MMSWVIGFCHDIQGSASLLGRRSKGKGKGIRARDHARPSRSLAPNSRT